MSKRMLIDATHAEETRVVVMDSSRLVEYDVEAASKKQLKGNIYLARVVRVEPSLQAAFVEYGGNRHGFLAFGEIHPDYYQIPVADRQRLLELQEQEAREQEQAEEAELNRGEASRDDAQPDMRSDDQPPVIALAAPVDPDIRVAGPEAQAEFPQAEADQAQASESDQPFMAHEGGDEAEGNAGAPEPEAAQAGDDGDDVQPETIGGEHDTSDDSAAADRRSVSRLLRHYKIQEVIRRRQVLLVQVVKEERGTKGAALTTYISMAGRYSVLMPNSPRGGGVSRKITSASDRRRLKEITQELELPRGMGIIVRTAGASRPKPEIKRDGETLLNLWDDIRERTLQSTAPALIHEEASLIKRALRDSYSGDVEEVMVDGEDGWRAARDFMRLMMPTHARKVTLWRDPSQSLFGRYQVEAQLDGMLHPTVQLRSGGYLVINQTEALVAIDVNSGRSTRERGIEETALRTNMEAAEEVARQLRLRDLAGLIVIDFIDMESRRNNSAVERRMKDALASDRARIQLGQISHFGLMEMSRQRLRPSLAETSFVSCTHCGGVGLVRSTESAALHVLRALEDEGAKRRAGEVLVHVASAVILYILNHKRDKLTEIEARCGMQVVFQPDNSLPLPQIRMERTRPYQPHVAPAMKAIAEDDQVDLAGDVEDDIDAGVDDDAQTPSGQNGEAESADRPRRRRRRRGGRGQNRRDNSGAEAGAEESDADTDDDDAETGETADSDAEAIEQHPVATQDSEQPIAPVAEEGRAPRRRGRRPPRRNAEQQDASDSEASSPQQHMPQQISQRAEPVAVPIRPAYSGPTPADPFGGGSFDIFDALEQASMGGAPLDAHGSQMAETSANDGGRYIKPVMVDENLAPPPKRRGWWRRS